MRSTVDYEKMKESYNLIMEKSVEKGIYIPYGYPMSISVMYNSGRHPMGFDGKAEGIERTVPFTFDEIAMNVANQAIRLITEFKG